jgi:pimeloyl-ACP methyl ester carboxylesterase
MARFTTSDGLSLYFEDSGAGQPLLCLAGLTRNSRDFDFPAPHLADLRLIRMDYRGRGLSDFDSDPGNYNVMREGMDALELLDHLGLEKVCILGTSRGGMIAMTLAAGHIGRIGSVILNDVGPVVGAAGIARIMAYVGQPPAFATLDEAAAGLQAAMAGAFPGVALPVWRQMAAAQYRETETGLSLHYDPRLLEALTAQAAEAPIPDLWPFFEALAPVPVGVVRGANSDILQADTLGEMQARHPGLVSAVVPDRGHAPFLDEPKALDVIRRILKAAP